MGHLFDKGKCDRQKASNTIAIRLIRWFLGGFFIYMGLSKALAPVDFLKVIRQYQIIENYLLLNSVAAILPWFEVFCGLMLLAGIAVRGTSLILFLLVMTFSALVLKHALAIMSIKAISLCAVKFDCGCGNGEIFICQKLVENIGLMILCGGLFFVRTNPSRITSDANTLN